MGADFGQGWQSDNKNQSQSTQAREIKTPKEHKLRFAKEKRRGKTVTIAKTFYLEKTAEKALLKSLKKKLGTGGTAKDHSLEFQGDIQATLKTALENLGFN